MPTMAGASDQQHAPGDQQVAASQSQRRQIEGLPRLPRAALVEDVDAAARWPVDLPAGQDAAAIPAQSVVHGGGERAVILPVSTSIQCRRLPLAIRFPAHAQQMPDVVRRSGGVSQSSRPVAASSANTRSQSDGAASTSPWWIKQGVRPRAATAVGLAPRQRDLRITGDPLDLPIAGAHRGDDTEVRVEVQDALVQRQQVVRVLDGRSLTETLGGGDESLPNEFAAFGVEGRYVRLGADAVPLTQRDVQPSVGGHGHAVDRPTVSPRQMVQVDLEQPFLVRLQVECGQIAERRRVAAIGDRRRRGLGAQLDVQAITGHGQRVLRKPQLSAGREAPPTAGRLRAATASGGSEVSSHSGRPVSRS